MTKLYIILSIVGWAWLIVAAVVVPIKLRRTPEPASMLESEPHPKQDEPRH